MLFPTKGPRRPSRAPVAELAIPNKVLDVHVISDTLQAMAVVTLAHHPSVEEIVGLCWGRCRIVQENYPAVVTARVRAPPHTRAIVPMGGRMGNVRSVHVQKEQRGFLIHQPATWLIGMNWSAVAPDCAIRPRECVHVKPHLRVLLVN